MKIKVSANKDAIKENREELVWLVVVPGKTYFCREVRMSALGMTVFEKEIKAENESRAWIEFPDASLEIVGDMAVIF